MSKTSWSSSNTLYYVPSWLFSNSHQTHKHSGTTTIHTIHNYEALPQPHTQQFCTVMPFFISVMPDAPWMSPLWHVNDNRILSACYECGLTSLVQLLCASIPLAAVLTCPGFTVHWLLLPLLQTGQPVSDKLTAAKVPLGLPTDIGHTNTSTAHTTRFLQESAWDSWSHHIQGLVNMCIWQLWWTGTATNKQLKIKSH